MLRKASMLAAAGVITSPVKNPSDTESLVCKPSELPIYGSIHNSE